MSTNRITTPTKSNHHNQHHQSQQRQQQQELQEEQDQFQYFGLNRRHDCNDQTDGYQSTNLTTTSSTNQLNAIKAQLSSLNEQLLSTLVQDNDINGERNDLNVKNSIKPIELITMISRVEQCCNELIKSAMTLQQYTHQQQSKYESIKNNFNNEMQGQRLQLKQEQLELKQQQIDFQQQMNQQQLELKQYQFELNQRECKLNQIEQIHTTSTTNSTTSTTPSTTPSTTSSTLHSTPIPISTTTSQLISHDISLQQPIQSSSPSLSLLSSPSTSRIQDSSSGQSAELLQHVLEDYQAMKYLVEQSITTQQLCQQHYATLINQKMNGVEQLETQTVSKLNKIDQIESQLHQLQQSTTTLSNQSSQFEQRFISIETNYQPNASTIAANQREKVPIILKTNRKLKKKKYEYIAFQFVNFPDVQCSCGHWGNASFRFILYDCLIENIFPSKLKPLLATIQLSKLFISTKSVLDGEWIQIQGDGKIVDINDIEFHDLLKQGDDIYQYSDYPCHSCEDHAPHNDEATKRFLIKIKWE